VRILIVEDDPDGGEMLAALIEELGHEVQVATTGERALALAAQPPHVAFVDLLLPDMHGIELASRLGAIAPQATLVALTGLITHDSEQKARAAGFEHYLLKPYRIEQIEAVLAGLAAG
jgi:CheY-like chemotaxis protein